MTTESDAAAGRTTPTAFLGALDASSLHPLAWLAWLASASALVFLTANPLYLSLAFLACGAVYLSVRDSAKGRALTPFVLIGLALAALSVPLNVLMGSTGPTELASLPVLTFPSWLGGVTFGGRITGEALVTAAGRAISIATLVLAAAAFNAAIDHFRLLRLAPRALSQLMLSMTIAVLVIPESATQARRVAEARRLRGRSARGLAALPALLLPTLQGALERSIQRAESLDARGFGAGGSNAGPLSALAGIGGLGLVSWGAFAHFYFGPNVPAAVAMLAGAGLIVAAVLAGGGAKRSMLRVDSWTALDVVVTSTSVLALVLLLALRVAGVGDIVYLAYPEVVAPGFHGVAALAFVLLLVPALQDVIAGRPEAGE